MTTALMHFSYHQMQGDGDTCICAFCGSTDGHMPTLNKTGKKYLFPDACCFAGNMLNVKKLQTIKCSFPLKNFPMECPSCSETFWRFDMKTAFVFFKGELTGRKFLKMEKKSDVSRGCQKKFPDPIIEKNFHPNCPPPSPKKNFHCQSW